MLLNTSTALKHGKDLLTSFYTLYNVLHNEYNMYRL